MGNPNFYKVFAGNSNPALAKAVVQNLGRELSAASVGAFSDGEIQVEIGENVRGTDTFIIQSTSPNANHNLMELLIMADALKRSSAGSISAVIPYYGYARQDRKVAPRVPITAKLVADLIEAAGVTRVVSMDMHAGQIQGFFNIPFDHLYAAPIMLEHMKQQFTDSREPGHRLARRRRRGARPRLLEAHGPRARHRRQAAHQGQRGRDHERHRRRQRQGGHPARRHDRHGRHAHPGRRGHQGEGRHARSTPTPPTRCSPGRRWSGSARSPIE